jgi:hypothetical protein
MVEEEMLLLAAKSEGLESDPEVKKKLEDARKEMLVQAFLDKKQNEASRVTDEEIRDYYEAHPEESKTEEALRVRMLISKNREKLENIRNQVAEGKVEFAVLARRHAENKEMADVGGLIPEWVYKGQAIPWIGNHPEFHEVAFSMKLGEISPVVETPKGFLILSVEERREPELRSIEQMRAQIEEKLTREKSTSALPRLLDDLKKRYRVKIYEPQGKSAEALFSAAQSETDPHQRIKIYQEILDRHPDDPHAAEALFMIGFIQSEELKDEAAARATFEKVVKDYPNSELIKDAKWMLSDEAQRPPKFEGDTSRAAAGGAS